MGRHILFIGGGGTVGRATQKLFRDRGCDVSIWNRSVSPLHDFKIVGQQLREIAPSVVINLAVASDSMQQGISSTLINCDLPIELARLSNELKFRLIHTSSVMVFTSANPGPYTVNSTPDADSGYGWEKRQAEVGIQCENPDAIIVRLGWQIGNIPGGNHMVDFLERASESGPIKASRLWLPSCSFLHQTSNAIWNLLEHSGGIYQMNTNQGDSFYNIVLTLRKRLHKDHWLVEADDSYVHNQLMLDERICRAKLWDVD